MDYLNRLAATVLGVILLVVVVTAILTFIGVPEVTYKPYLFFLVAIVVLSAILSPQPISMIASK